jgi:hypothetical protein
VYIYIIIFCIYNYRSKSCRAGAVPRVAQRSRKSESRRASRRKVLRRKVLSRSTPLAYHSKRRKSGKEARGGEVEGD